MSEKTWYYVQGEEAVGPVTEEDLTALLKSGELSVETLVFSSPMTDWMPASSIPELVKNVPPPIPSTPSATPPPMPPPSQQTSPPVQQAPPPHTMGQPFAQAPEEDNGSVYLKMFLYAGLPFGFIMGLWFGDMVAGLIGGVLFGAIMSAVMGSMQKNAEAAIPQGPRVAGEKRKGVHQIRIVQVAHGMDSTFNHCLIALQQFGNCQIQMQNPHQGIIKARTGWSRKSVGETIDINLASLGAHTQVRISSKPVLITTIADSGKNAENVEAISAYLRAV